MISGVRPRGYTVVEVMIFLAVSGALLASSIALVSSQQSRTEFAQSVRETESRIKDIVNDVSTGFYPSANQIKCDPKIPAGSGISLTSANVEQGTNAGCIFIGRVIQFAPQGSDFGTMRIYTVAGQRQVPAPPSSSLREITSIEESKGRAIAKGTAAGDPTPDTYEDVSLGLVKVGKVTYTSGASTKTTGGIGFFTTFNSYSGNALDSGSTSANLAPLSDVAGAFTLNQDPRAFVDQLENALAAPGFSNTINPSGGVTICLLSQSTDQFALISIGGASRTLTTNLVIDSGKVCP